MELTNDQTLGTLELEKLQEDYLPETTKDLTKGLSAAVGLSNGLQAMATLLMKGAIALRRSSYATITALYEKGFDGVKVSDELYEAVKGNYSLSRSSRSHALSITILSILVSDYRDYLVTGDFTDIFGARSEEDLLGYISLCFPELDQRIIISAYKQAKEILQGKVDLEEADIDVERGV